MMNSSANLAAVLKETGPFIPAKVRYDKSLPQEAMLLYGEITALAKKTRSYCNARCELKPGRIKRFAKLFETGEKTVFEWIKLLHNVGYIELLNLTPVLKISGTGQVFFNRSL